jgi:toxin ParE1/3/4
VNRSVHELATEELAAAAAWYERERPGLGFDFLEEAERGLDAIVAAPLAWPFADRRTQGARARRFLLARFPYAIVYVVGQEEIRVLAFSHSSRRPGYWRDRSV